MPSSPAFPMRCSSCRELGVEAELVTPAAGRAELWFAGRLRPIPAGLVLGVPRQLGGVLRSRNPLADGHGPRRPGSGPATRPSAGDVDRPGAGRRPLRRPGRRSPRRSAGRRHSRRIDGDARGGRGDAHDRGGRATIAQPAARASGGPGLAIAVRFSPPSDGASASLVGCHDPAPARSRHPLRVASGSTRSPPRPTFRSPFRRTRRPSTGPSWPRPPRPPGRCSAWTACEGLARIPTASVAW